jgi:hypothetical protein
LPKLSNEAKAVRRNTLTALAIGHGLMQTLQYRNYIYVDEACMTHFFFSYFLGSPAVLKIILVIVAIAGFKYVAAKKGRWESICYTIPIAAVLASLVLTRSLTYGLAASYICLFGFMLMKSRYRKCSDCKETVIREAVKCKHCGSSISPA